MPDSQDQRWWRRGDVRGLGWTACLALWTVALLTTQPAVLGKEVLPEPMHFPSAKVLHVGAYAFLAASACWLPLGRGRWLLVALLSLHAAATEYLQLFVPGRTGAVTDVLIDHVGLLLGLALTCKGWTFRAERSPEPVADSPTRT